MWPNEYLGGEEKLHELSKSHSTPDGTLVSGHVFVRHLSEGDRYEIRVDGFGQRAVVDVHNPAHLESQRDAVMAVFAAAGRLRLRFSVSW